MTNPAAAAVATAWRRDRPYLVDLAYRMLGDVGAAEDVVQEAFTRLSLVPNGEVRDERGWLTVVTSRLCLDQLRSARARRERSREAEWLEDLRPLVAAEPLDPADRVTLDEEVREALGHLLSRLTPAERVAFVLHDVFQLSFASVGETLGRPPATCRQLASRARVKIAEQRAPGQVPADVRKRVDGQLHVVASAFLSACAGGDLEALTALLHPDVWGIADFVLGAPPRRHPTRGANQQQRGRVAVGTTLLRFFGSGTTLVTLPTRSGLAFLAMADRRPYALITADVADGLMRRLHVLADPTARPVSADSS